MRRNVPNQNRLLIFSTEDNCWHAYEFFLQVGAVAEYVLWFKLPDDLYQEEVWIVLKKYPDLSQKYHNRRLHRLPVNCCYKTS